MMALSLLAACLLSCALAAEEAKKPDAPKKPSTLAPTVPYLELWTFVYGKDASTPKVLYIPKAPDDDEEPADSEPPSWLTSAAMAFKDGRTYKAKFAIVPAKDASRTAKRFGLEAADLPLLFGCSVAESGTGGVAHRLPASELRGGAATVRAIKSFVGDLVGGSLSEEAEGAVALPTFPEPTRPRKQASASLEEFTHESLPLSCYSGPRPLCVVAILDQPAGQTCPEVMESLARKFKNDKTIAFGWVGAARQREFLSAFGLAAGSLPALVAVKGGKRPRAARMEAGGLDDVTPMAAFVDALLGGSATFKRLADGLPELEAPYLLDDEPTSQPEKEEV